jgi:glycosyltransferase involved in cell wall biosynthesis
VFSENFKTDRPLFSIIIPTRNEANDIVRTLDACLAINYEPKEIIVVDDSSDETVQIVERYADRGVKLVHRQKNSNGCCGARNLGMQLARGDILVILNADDVPRPDFLKRLLKHYQRGVDYVIVKSVVLNQENPWGKLISASGMDWSGNEQKMEWSEGFSCRRSAAEAVGYIPGDFPVPFCRDWMFGAALSRAGFKKHVDLNIIMEHVTPATFASFWHNQIWRGMMWAPSAFYFRHQSLFTILFKEILKAVRQFFKNILVIPKLWRAVRSSKYVSGGFRDTWALYFAGLVQDVALTVGAFKGISSVARAEGWWRHAKGSTSELTQH